jgi:hypothetical protein
MIASPELAFSSERCFRFLRREQHGNADRKRFVAEQSWPGVRIPKFALLRDDLVGELRNRKDTGSLLILVWLWFRSPHTSRGILISCRAHSPITFGEWRAAQVLSPSALRLQMSPITTHNSGFPSLKKKPLEIAASSKLGVRSVVF